MNTLVSYPLEWVGQGLLVFLAIGLALSAGVGVALILRPGSTLRIHPHPHARSQRWVDDRDFQERLQQAWYLEDLFYRYHRLLGGAMVAGAVFVLGSWMRAYDQMQALGVLTPQALDGIAARFESAAVVIHLLVLLLGAVILTRPGLIKDLLIKSLEGRAHPDGGSDDFAALLNREREAVEHWLVLYPRLLGLVALCGSTYAVLALCPALLSMLHA